MAEIQSIDMNDHDISVRLRITNSEYELLKHSRYDLLLLPSDTKTLENTLTTGKLGNSNRIMLPKKILEKEKLKLEKKVRSKIFKVNDEAYLLIKLRESNRGVPVFKEDLK